MTPTDHDAVSVALLDDGDIDYVGALWSTDMNGSPHPDIVDITVPVADVAGYEDAAEVIARRHGYTLVSREPADSGADDTFWEIEPLDGEEQAR